MGNYARASSRFSARHGYCGTERSRGEQNASDEITEAQEFIKASTTELKAEESEKFAQKQQIISVICLETSQHGFPVAPPPSWTTS
jgi:hypothetical protein